MYSKIHIFALLSALVAALAQVHETTDYTVREGAIPLPTGSSVVYLQIPSSARADSLDTNGGGWGGRGGGDQSWDFKLDGDTYKEEP
jgi:hypothetical protein